MGRGKSVDTVTVIRAPTHTRSKQCSLCPTHPHPLAVGVETNNLYIITARKDSRGENPRTIFIPKTEQVKQNEAHRMLFQAESGRHRGHVRIRSRATNTFLFFLGIKQPLTWVVSSLLAFVLVVVSRVGGIVVLVVEWFCSLSRGLAVRVWCTEQPLFPLVAVSPRLYRAPQHQSLDPAMRV